MVLLLVVYDIVIRCIGLFPQCSADLRFNQFRVTKIKQQMRFYFGVFHEPHEHEQYKNCLALLTRLIVALKTETAAIDNM